MMTIVVYICVNDYVWMKQRLLQYCRPGMAYPGIPADSEKTGGISKR